MPDTNWSELADLRYNKELKDFNKIKSKDEYIRKLEEFFSGSKAGMALLQNRKRSWKSISDEMYEGSSAKDIVEKNQQEKKEPSVRERAMITEISRSPRSRKQDESQTAKNLKPLTMANYRRWRKNPASGDLNGIDTRNRRRYVDLKRRARTINRKS